MSTTAYLALGSNLGVRQRTLRDSLARLQGAGVMIGRVSSLYETAPVSGPPGQGPYLNAVAEIQTTLTARALLDLLLDVEKRLGRVRGERWGPRTIDLDLLLYDDRVIREPGLDVPHPCMQERWFVLAPLAEIAPQVVHPVLYQTIGDLLAALPPGEPAGKRVGTMASESWKVQEALGIEPSVGETRVPGRELSGLRAAVTGATSGIGRAIALELAAGGAAVLVH